MRGDSGECSLVLPSVKNGSVAVLDTAYVSAPSFRKLYSIKIVALQAVRIRVNKEPLSPVSRGGFV